MARALLAWRAAYRAAIPCMMTLLLYAKKASPQVTSGAGSHPAVSWYQAMTSCFVGRPGIFPGRKASCPRPMDRAVGDSAVVNGDSKLQRSERGCPSVAISQLTSGSASLLPMAAFLCYSLEDTDHPRLCLVEDKVINLVVSVHKA